MAAFDTNDGAGSPLQHNFPHFNPSFAPASHPVNYITFHYTAILDWRWHDPMLCMTCMTPTRLPYLWFLTIITGSRPAEDFKRLRCLEKTLSQLSMDLRSSGRLKLIYRTIQTDGQGMSCDILVLHIPLESYSFWVLKIFTSMPLLSDLQVDVPLLYLIIRTWIIPNHGQTTLVC